jgi:hypothetical protein
MKGQKDTLRITDTRNLKQDTYAAAEFLLRSSVSQAVSQYIICYSLSLDSILQYTDPVHALKTHIFSTHFNIIRPVTPNSPPPKKKFFLQVISCVISRPLSVV